MSTRTSDLASQLRNLGFQFTIEFIDRNRVIFKTKDGFEYILDKHYAPKHAGMQVSDTYRFIDWYSAYLDRDLKSVNKHNNRGIYA